MEQLQRKELTTHKVLKLLKKVEASVNIQLNIDLKSQRATNAATHFQGNYTSIQIREPATTEAAIGGIL